MKLGFLLLFVFCSLCSLAADLTRWYSGSIVLKSQEVLVGEISVRCDAVLLKHATHIQVLPAHMLQTIRFYDGKANINRKFISLSDRTVGFRSHELFEVVLTGEIYVLRRPRYSLINPSNTEDANNFLYFIKTSDDLVPLRNFKKLILPGLIKNSKQSVVSFMKKNKLNANESASAILIIEHYNKIQFSGISLALK